MAETQTKQAPVAPDVDLTPETLTRENVEEHLLGDARLQAQGLGNEQVLELAKNMVDLLNNGTAAVAAEAAAAVKDAAAVATVANEAAAKAEAEAEAEK